MAEAARNVRHYVSDCLEERHPYDVQKGFAGRPARDAGKVFDGMLSSSIDHLLNSLTDPSVVDDDERAKAAHHLYAHSASQEMKIDLIKKDTVPIVVSVLNRSPSHLLEQQCFMLLRSLCVIPQGCYPVVECGGLEAAIRSISLNTENLEVRRDARTAAAHAILQVASNFAGLRWMLAMEDCSEFILAGVEYPLSEFIVTKEDILQCITGMLQEDGTPEAKIALYAISTLAQICAVSHGIRAFTKDMALVDTVCELVASFAEESEWSKEGTAFLVQLLTVVWNVSMDQEGVELLGEKGAHISVLKMFRTIRSKRNDVPLPVQRVLMGALSALYKLNAVKLGSDDPMDEQPTLVHALIEYLREINTIVDAAKADNKNPTLDIVAISKNTVQCIRMASELRNIRAITHKYIDVLHGQDSTEAFYFRRQLYYGTAWEDEFCAYV